MCSPSCPRGRSSGWSPRLWRRCGSAPTSCCFSIGVSDYAAVDDSVELAKLHSRGGAPTVNAVLRRAAREGRALLAALDDSTPKGAAILHSVPDWLAELWWRELGRRGGGRDAAAVNEPAETAIRVNTLRAGARR